MPARFASSLPKGALRDNIRLSQASDALGGGSVRSEADGPEARDIAEVVIIFIAAE
jgi:hypothetical protein